MFSAIKTVLWNTESHWCVQGGNYGNHLKYSLLSFLVCLFVFSFCEWSVAK